MLSISKSPLAIISTAYRAMCNAHHRFNYPGGPRPDEFPNPSLMSTLVCLELRGTGWVPTLHLPNFSAATIFIDPVWCGIVHCALHTELQCSVQCSAGPDPVPLLVITGIRRHQAEAGGWAPSYALLLAARPGLSGLGCPAPCRTSSSPRSAP